MGCSDRRFQLEYDIIGLLKTDGYLRIRRPKCTEMKLVSEIIITKKYAWGNLQSPHSQLSLSSPSSVKHPAAVTSLPRSRLFNLCIDIWNIWAALLIPTCCCYTSGRCPDVLVSFRRRLDKNKRRVVARLLSRETGELLNQENKGYGSVLSSTLRKKGIFNWGFCCILSKQHFPVGF